MNAPPLALGTVQWGLAYGLTNNRPIATPVGEVQQLLTRARYHGILRLDTARAYGQSEALIGQMTAGDVEWQIITKLDPGAMTAEAAHASLQASLFELRRSEVNTVLLHRWGQRYADGGKLWATLRHAKAQGAVRHLGASVGSPAEAWEALADDQIDAIQVASSVFDLRLLRGGFFAAAALAGKTIYVRSLFLQGVAFLAMDHLPVFLTELRPTLVMMREWCQRHEVGVAVACLAFLHWVPEAVGVLGCDQSGRVDEYVGAWRAATGVADDLKQQAIHWPEATEAVLNPAQWPKAAT